MKRYVKAAEDKTAEALETSLDNLNEDFDYILDGFDKLARMGKESQDVAMQLALQLSGSLQETVKQIAAKLQ